MEKTLTKTAHTAGPWSVRKISERLYGVNDAKGVAVADLHAIQGRHTSANARLIAAAPEMLAALIQAEIAVEQLCCEQDPANECWNILRQIRAAISKATGAA